MSFDIATLILLAVDAFTVTMSFLFSSSYLFFANTSLPSTDTFTLSAAASVLLSKTSLQVLLSGINDVSPSAGEMTNISLSAEYFIAVVTHLPSTYPQDSLSSSYSSNSPSASGNTLTHNTSGFLITDLASSSSASAHTSMPPAFANTGMLLKSL